jgi:putative copper resistance protein D
MAVDATVLPGLPAIDPAVRKGIPVTLPPASPIAGGPRWLLPSVLFAGIVALVACLFVGGSTAVAAVAGLPDAGGGTQWALPVASFIAETAAVLALGGALLAAALIPPRGDVAAIRARCLRTAGSLAALAAAATVVVFLLTVSDLTARPLPDALTLPAIASVAAFGPGRLLVISTALSAAGAAAALLTARSLPRFAGSPVRGRQIRLVLSTGLLAAALIPWALGGHTTQSGADIAASSLIVHVLAAGAWIGGLAIMVLHVRSHLLVTVLPRFSTLALWCWISIGVSGVITGWLRVGQVSDLWTTGYGRLLLVKLVALGVLGTFGYWHRRRLAAGLRARSVGNFGALLRLAAVEVLVMGATMGVATALSATAPPVGHAVGHEAAHGVPRIEAMAGHPVPVISLENLAIAWRPDVIVLLIVALSLSGYLIGVRRFRAAGGSWPAGRVCWAVAAAAAAVVALNSGIATYDGVVWSVTVTQQAITSMIVPLGVVLARPWELVGRTGTVGRVLGAVRAHPLLVLGSYAGWTVLSLLTPIALWSVSSHGLLMVIRTGDIVIGAALFALLLPAQRSRDRGSAPFATTLLMAWFALQAAVTGILLAGGALAARPWFTELNIAWITVAQDERTAALIHLGIATIVLLLVSALPAEKSTEIRTSTTTARNILQAAIASVRASE